jgi:hypothetical protein
VIDQGAPLGWFAPDFKILDPVWNYYVKLFAPITIDKDETKRYLELRTGGIFECWSMQSGIVARSRQYKRAVVDEAAHIDNFKSRFEYEIGATLLDQIGDAWLFSSTNGDNDFKYYFDLGQNPIEPDWASFHLETWMNPFLPSKERERVRKLCVVDMDPVARQEYGAEFISGTENFVPPAWVDACGLSGDWWKPLDPHTPICVGIDAGYKSDTFAISGQGRDYNTGKYKPAFVKVFHPDELVDQNGVISFARPKQFLRDVARQYHVISFAYDPYQLINMAGELQNEGVGMFEEFPQTTKRAMADQNLYELIRDRNWEFNMFEHTELAQHIKNANSKIEAGEKRRMVKRNDNLKIDSAVATSMALFALSQYNV